MPTPFTIGSIVSCLFCNIKVASIVRWLDGIIKLQVPWIPLLVFVSVVKLIDGVNEKLEKSVKPTVGSANTSTDVPGSMLFSPTLEFIDPYAADGNGFSVKLNDGGGDGVGVDAGPGVNVGVTVMVSVGVTVGVIVCEGVIVGVRVMVGVTVCVGVDGGPNVGVTVKVGVGVLVGVTVGVDDATIGAVGVGVRVRVGVGVRVTVGVGVGVGMRFSQPTFSVSLFFLLYATPSFEMII